MVLVAVVVILGSFCLSSEPLDRQGEDYDTILLSVIIIVEPHLYDTALMARLKHRQLFSIHASMHPSTISTVSYPSTHIVE